MSQGIEKDPDQRIDSDRGTFDIERDDVSAEERESGTAGLPTADDVPEETVEEIQRERAERLDPDNRPEDTEVDNSGRTFDSPRRARHLPSRTVRSNRGGTTVPP